MTCFHAAVIGFSLVTHEAQCIPITPTALCICSSTWCLFLSFVSGVLVSVGVLSLFFNTFQELSTYEGGWPFACDLTCKYPLYT